MAIEKKTALIKEHRVWCTYALTAAMVYVYGCERHALAWGILGPLVRRLCVSMDRIFVQSLGRCAAI